MIHPYNLGSLTESCLNPDTKWNEDLDLSEKKKKTFVTWICPWLTSPAAKLRRETLEEMAESMGSQWSRWISPTSRWISPTTKCLRGFTWIPWFHTVITNWKGPRDLDEILFGWELDPIIRLILWQRDGITLGCIKMYQKQVMATIRVPVPWLWYWRASGFWTLKTTYIQLLHI